MILLYFTCESRYNRSQTNSQGFISFNFNRAASGLLAENSDFCWQLQDSPSDNGMFEFTCTINHCCPVVDVLLSRYFLCWLHVFDVLKINFTSERKPLMSYILWLANVSYFIPVVYTPLSYWLFLIFCNFTPLFLLIMLFSFSLLVIFLNFSFYNMCTSTVWSNSPRNFQKKALRETIKQQ